MVSTVEEESPSADDLAITLQQILSCAHRVAPTFRKLLDEQARSFLQSVKPFRLLDLPRELRDAIYSYTTVADDHLLLSGPCKHEDWPTAVQPAITRVNRQVSQESLPIFYGDNTFEAHMTAFDFGYFLSHMQIIGSRNLTCIRPITFSCTAGNHEMSLVCAAGLFDFVRWYVTTQGAREIQFYEGPPRERETLIYGAVSLALGLRQQGRTSEERMRLAFGDWLQSEHPTCCCAATDSGGWGDENEHKRCIRRKEFFHRSMPRYCELDERTSSYARYGWGYS
ncbi:hypothetical protein LTR97_005623 [Elasticomyces elasticus]|uniref:F-box domain-containing protein n=1 Tax=Elasticomyces elasticus TaxID=574655 RepID=A0AAN7W3J0_9PEZI|nr:hypothetical protein LTR97_005623 [Elasticomyces elasticus]